MAPVFMAQASSTLVLRRIISIYSASVTSVRRSKSMSYCCPSPISRAVSVNRSSTGFSFKGAHWAMRWYASTSMESPERMAVLASHLR